MKTLLSLTLLLLAVRLEAGTVTSAAAGPLHTMTVDLTSLALDATTVQGVHTQCWSGTGFSGGAITGIRKSVRVQSIDALTTTSITINFGNDVTAFSNVACSVTGGASGGSGTVNTGTAGQMAYYASSTTAVSGNANATISTGTLTLGSSGVAGGIVLNGATSGTTTLSASSTAGTLNLGSTNASVTSGGALTATGFQEALHTPASSSEACTTGQFADDADFHYVCTATDTWKRVALSSF